MTEQEAAYSAWEQRQQERSYHGFSQPVASEENFIAGFEAGAAHIREAVLKLWDENGAWIGGGRYRELAEILHVPPERTQTQRTGGEPRPSGETLTRGEAA